MHQPDTKEVEMISTRQRELVLRRINILLSFVLAGIFFFSGLWDGEVVEGILLAYAYWSWWWGLQLLWPKYKSWAKYEGNAIDAFLMRLWYPIFYFPIYLMLAGVVGIFGGGIYKFIKYLKGVQHNNLY